MRSQVSMKKHAWFKLTCFLSYFVFRLWDGGWVAQKWNTRERVQSNIKPNHLFLPFLPYWLFYIRSTILVYIEAWLTIFFRVFCQKPEHLRLFPTRVPSCRCLECRPTRNISLLIFQQRRGQIQAPMTSNVLLLSWQIDLPWLRSFHLDVPWE